MLSLSLPWSCFFFPLYSLFNCWIWSGTIIASTKSWLLLCPLKASVPLQDRQHAPWSHDTASLQQLILFIPVQLHCKEWVQFFLNLGHWYSAKLEEENNELLTSPSPPPTRHIHTTNKFKPRWHLPFQYSQFFYILGKGIVLWQLSPFKWFLLSVIFTKHQRSKPSMWGELLVRREHFMWYI